MLLFVARVTEDVGDLSSLALAFCCIEITTESLGMFPLSVMNLLLETTLFCTLCQNWLRLENARQNLRHGQVI